LKTGVPKTAVRDRLQRVGQRPSAKPPQTDRTTTVYQRSLTGQDLPYALLNSMAQSCHSDERGPDVSSTVRTTAVGADVESSHRADLLLHHLMVGRDSYKNPQLPR
jgi:hypothetical protein